MNKKAEALLHNDDPVHVVRKPMPTMEQQLEHTSRNARKRATSQHVDATASAICDTLRGAVQHARAQNHCELQRTHSSLPSAQPFSFRSAKLGERIAQGAVHQLEHKPGDAVPAPPETDANGARTGYSAKNSINSLKQFRDECTGIVDSELAWVRHLVAYVDSSPLPLHPSGANVSHCHESSSPDAAAEGNEEVTSSTEPYETYVLPASAEATAASEAPTCTLQPRSRQDVTLLEHWLRDMLSEVAAHLPDEPEGRKNAAFTKETPNTAQLQATQAADSAQQEDAVHARVRKLTNEALWVYRLAFEEVIRQVSRHSHERAETLGRVWEHFFQLIELRSDLRKEEELSSAIENALTWKKAHDEQRSAVQDSQVELHKIQETKDNELEQVERQRATVASRLENVNAKLSDERERSKHLNGRLVEEVSNRLQLEQELDDKHDELERAKKEHEDAEARVQYAERRIEELQEALNERYSALTERDASIDSLTNELRDYERTRSEMASRISSLQEELSTERSNTRKERSEVKQLKKTLSELQSEHNEKLEANERLERELKSVRASATQLRSELDDASNQKENLQNENDSLSRLLQREKHKYEETASALEKEREYRHQVAEQLQNERDNLQQCLQSEENKHSQVKEYLADLQQQHVDLQKLQQSTSESLQSAKEGLFQCMSDEEAPQRADAIDARQWIDTFVLRLQDAQALAEQKSNQCAVLACRQKDEEDRRRSLENSLYDERLKTQRLERERERISERAHHAEEGRDAAKQALEAYRMERDEVQKKFEEAKAKANEADSKMKELEGKANLVDDLRKELNRVQNQRCPMCIEHENQLSDVQQQLRDMSQEKLRVEIDIERARKERDDETAARKESEAAMRAERKRAEHAERDVHSMQNKLQQLQRIAAVRKRLIDGLTTNTAIGIADSETVEDSTGKVDDASALSMRMGAEGEYIYIAPCEAGALLRASTGIMGWQCKRLRHLLGEANLKIESLSNTLMTERNERQEFEHQMNDALDQLVESKNKAEDNMGELRDALISSTTRRRSRPQQQESVVLERMQSRSKRGSRRESQSGEGYLRNEQADDDAQKGQQPAQRDAASQANDTQLQAWLMQVGATDASEHDKPMKTQLEMHSLVSEVYNVRLKRLSGNGSRSKSDALRRRHQPMPSVTVFDDLRDFIVQSVDEHKAEAEMAAVLSACRAHRAASLKIDTFARFVQVGEDTLDADDYDFFVHLIGCLKKLLGLDWRTVSQDWTYTHALLPARAAADLLANLYNASAISNTPYATLVQPYICDGKLGKAIDLDTFLARLVSERRHEAGELPVQALASPRRIAPADIAIAETKSRAHRVSERESTASQSHARVSSSSSGNAIMHR